MSFTLNFTVLMMFSRYNFYSGWLPELMPVPDLKILGRWRPREDGKAILPAYYSWMLLLLLLSPDVFRSDVIIHQFESAIATRSIGSTYTRLLIGMRSLIDMFDSVRWSICLSLSRWVVFADEKCDLMRRPRRKNGAKWGHSSVTYRLRSGK